MQRAEKIQKVALSCDAMKWHNNDNLKFDDRFKMRCLKDLRNCAF